MIPSQFVHELPHRVGRPIGPRTGRVPRALPAPLRPPVAEPAPVVETLFDFTTTDPYRWMEDWQSPAGRTWLRDQARYADRVLAGLPEREALLDRLTALGHAGTARYSFRLVGRRLFYLRRLATVQVPQLVTRTRTDATEHVVLDPNHAGQDGEVHQAIDWFVPSPDGRRVAAGVSFGGSEDSTLVVLDTATGAICDQPIPHARFGGLSWLPDSSGFLYKRFTPGAGAAWTPPYAYLHRLGAEPGGDPQILGPQADPRIRWGPADHAQVVVHHDWLLGWVRTGEDPRIRVYRAHRAVLDRPGPVRWTPVTGLRANIRQFYALGDRLYLLRPGRGGRGEIIRTALAHPDLPRATVVVAESSAVLQRFWIQGHRLFVVALVAGRPELRCLDQRTGALTRVPVPGNIDSAMPDGDSLYLEISNWTAPPAVYRYTPDAAGLEDTGWCPPYPVPMQDVTVTQVRVYAQDGVWVPLTILALPGAAPPGPRRTILAAYGAYGQALLPTYNPLLRPWLERGGLYAIAHVRGGGEYGAAWHTAGQKACKRAGIGDLIRCAEFLVACGVTAPDRLVAEGYSAGGVVCAGAIVRRPDLWAGGLLRQTVLHMLRYEYGAGGPPNVPEFGSTLTRRGARALRAMDPFTALRPGVRYPPMLALVGLNDPRVPIWHAMKWVARLQDAAAGRPLAALLRVEFHAGHGHGSTRRQIIRELADRYAFALAACSAAQRAPDAAPHLISAALPAHPPLTRLADRAETGEAPAA
jgi:prolyl oligopeptidase